MIAAFLYLRIMVSVWMRTTPDDADAEPVRIPLRPASRSALAAAFTLVVGIVPGWLLDAAEHDHRVRPLTADAGLRGPAAERRLASVRTPMTGSAGRMAPACDPAAASARRCGG